MEHIDRIHENHASISIENHLNVKDTTNVCVKILPETVKYLQKVGENLIFLLSPLYFIVDLVAILNRTICIISAILSHIFLVMMLLCILKHALICYVTILINLTGGNFCSS